MDPKELRRLYNDYNWPSPYARLVVIKLGHDKDDDGQKIKRLTHEQALTILARIFAKTIPEFLQLKKEYVWERLGSTINNYRRERIPICPLKRNNPYYQ